MVTVWLIGTVVFEELRNKILYNCTQLYCTQMDLYLWEKKRTNVSWLYSLYRLISRLNGNCISMRGRKRSSLGMTGGKRLPTGKYLNLELKHATSNLYNICIIWYRSSKLYYFTIMCIIWLIDCIVVFDWECCNHNKHLTFKLITFPKLRGKFYSKRYWYLFLTP